ncbi:MAG: DUF4965 domain-containing protein [Bacteroidales bacterium]|nr:DUF4965 domain-containing protein [Bacteroidales bacterium]
MKRTIILLSGIVALCIAVSCNNSERNGRLAGSAELRAPAYPLITIDPYTSAWSCTDTLYNDAVRHWTGRVHSLIGAIRVDGQVYRFLGREILPREALLPSAWYEPWEGRYRLKEPPKGWEKPGFNDNAWETGKGAFGTAGMPALSTPWETEDIWIRREFRLQKNEAGEKLYLVYSHDDIFELYLNGKQLVATGYEWHRNVVLPLDRNLLADDGKNVIAVHCHNRTGGGLVDFGIFRDKEISNALTVTAVQRSVSVSATQTRYEFACGPVDLQLTFLSPILPAEPDILSRPVNYITYSASSADRKLHDVEIYLEATPEWAVDEIAQEVSVDRGQTGTLTYFKAGTTEQSILGKKGDDRRIDWGYFYLCAEQKPEITYLSGDYNDVKEMFALTGRLVRDEGTRKTYNMHREMPVMAFAEQLGQVGGKSASGYIMIGYDDIYSIQYFGDNLMAWWKKDGKVTMDDALISASSDYTDLSKKCSAFDRKLWKDAKATGGEKYAGLCVLAFRQSVAAHKLLKDDKGNSLFFSKENFSNGSIGTVDVTYPSAPLFLYYNPELLKGMMNPIFYFSESGKWTKPFAAHDVGTYPMANGQTYGGDMPVEESGNMLILTAAIAKVEGNAGYAEKHWDVLTQWADYLLQNGLDPENQLCTDDFAGHFAHNTNLSVKAIMGIAGYGMLASMLGKEDIAEKYSGAAMEMASKWMEMAEDGDHYRLTFDKPGTWSQKYNLIWDKILGLNIFPDEVDSKEVAYYLTQQNDFGLPLDNRKTYTKSDWITWTATLADDDQTFVKFIDPLYRYVTETPDRVPMSDWYETTNAKKVGFQARSVVGGYFIKMLDSKMSSGR